MSIIDPALLTLSGIAHRCAEEATRLRAHELTDWRYCYELFRRAIMDRDKQAWDLVCERFWPQVRDWVSRHRLMNLWPESPDALVGEAFARMWRACSVEMFERSQDLAHLLSYLRHCAESALIQHARAMQRRQLEISLSESDDDAASQLIESLETDTPDSQPPEEIVEAAQNRQLLWQQVQRCLHDEQERLVIHACFVLDLKPREIYARNKSQFKDVRDVYRVKERVFTRLRGDEQLAELFR
jgi:RNA polymerase sigma factor (sigma-70 family)